eukprot:GDKH01012874.1.p1 GENE.GDKH01012874.1~~GDKH01012874.1.p1  ORF type:complete len:375 (-),score=46.87 GDKH01012874.1:321-1445(-)
MYACVFLCVCLYIWGRSVLVCIEMEYLKGAGETFGQIVSEQGVEAAFKYENDVFEKIQDAMDRGVTHNDLHPGNVGQFASGRAAVFDWGLAETCKTSVPDFLKPVLFAQQLATWALVASFIGPREVLSDIESQFRLMMRGEYPRYAKEVPLTLTDLREGDVHGVTAALQKHADNMEFGFHIPEKPIGALLAELALHGKIVYKINAAHVIVRFPKDSKLAPSVQSWQLNGMVNSWAANADAAEKRVAQIETEECGKVREWMQKSPNILWMMQGKGKEGVFDILTMETLEDDSEVRRFSFSVDDNGNKGDDVDIPNFYFHKIGDAQTPTTINWDWAADYAPLSVKLQLAQMAGLLPGILPVVVPAQPAAAAVEIII